MKCIYIICLIVFSSQLYAQENFVGRYHNYFGSAIDIRPDSTFKHEFRFDMTGSWSKGTWRIDNDTIYFKMIAIYDTLEYKDGKTNKVIDSLILSFDTIPNRIPASTVLGLPTVGQNYIPCPEKLFYKRGKLFIIRDGKLLKKKRRGFWVKKKFVPWYVRDKKSDI